MVEWWWYITIKGVYHHEKENYNRDKTSNASKFR